MEIKWTGRRAFRCRTCRSRWTDFVGQHDLAKCAGASIVSEEIIGAVSKVKCGAKCTGAVGPACDCSCGGENHGRG